MTLIPMNREWARAAGYDAAEMSRQKAGRRVWSRADYNRACRQFNRLWPVERDKTMADPALRRTFTTTILRGPISETAPDRCAAAHVRKGSSAGRATDGHESARRGSSR